MEKNQKFLELAKKSEKVYEELKAINKELKTVMEEIGVDNYIQDPDTLTVYKVIKPSGTYIEFKTIDYKRTALEGEKGGNPLSKKEAEEKGFILKK